MNDRSYNNYFGSLYDLPDRIWFELRLENRSRASRYATTVREKNRSAGKTMRFL